MQVSFAGYPAGTGLEAIAHRISDRWLESGEGYGVPAGEQVHLIDSFWCYDPWGPIAIQELPAMGDQRVTFGSLNSFFKINESVLRVWARVKDSRLVLLSREGSHRQWALDVLAEGGIEASRIRFVEPCSRSEYMELYQGIDIALDPFPYGGHITSLDALWMGVPVVTLVGQAPVSRAAFSIVSNLGLPELAGSQKITPISPSGWRETSRDWRNFAAPCGREWRDRSSWTRVGSRGGSKGRIGRCGEVGAQVDLASPVSTIWLRSPGNGKMVLPSAS